jgi:hypothetical protein
LSAIPSSRQRHKDSSTHMKTKKKTKKKETEMSSYRGTDPSTGNDKMIHNFELTGTGIGKALAPGGMVAKDRVSIVEAAVDVVALPCMFSATNSQMYEEVQGVTCVVKKETDLFTLLEAVEDASTPAFEQQDSRIRMFMYQRRYDDDQITDYLEHGLLPTITQRSVFWGPLEQDPVSLPPP